MFFVKMSVGSFEIRLEVFVDIITLVWYDKILTSRCFTVLRKLIISIIHWTQLSAREKAPTIPPIKRKITNG